MKLYIEQVDGDGLHAASFRVYDQHGRKVPGVTAATIRHDVNDASRLQLWLVIDGEKIRFGKPPVEPVDEG